MSCIGADRGPMNNLTESIDIREWAHQLDSLGRALLNGHMKALAWQDGMHELYSIVDLDSLLQSIGFEQIINNSDFNFIDQGGKFTHVKFLVETGAPDNMVVETTVTKIPKGISIYPHAHRNMVSAFLTLSGEFHVRQYDRLHEDEHFFYIRQTSDHFSQPGQWNSQSEDQNNVHWLTAMTDDSYLFSTKLTGINSSESYSSLLYMDPYGQELENGTIQAERIDRDRARTRFG